VPARTLFVGLDAADPFLLQRWSAEGALPRFAAFARGAAEFTLANPLAVVGGGVWQDLSTGRSCGRAGIFFPARQLHTGESALRQVEKHEVDPRAFWTAASDAGKRVAVIDVPHSVAPPELNGVFVAEWGTHDRLFGEQSSPPALLAELRDRHGDYPLWTRPWPRQTTAVCDGHDGGDKQYEQLLDDLLAGIEQKTGLLLDVLGREEWDLFACVFSEGQCSGHQLFHFLEDGAPRGHDRLASGIRLVYERLDASLGALIDAAGPDTSVLVVASHAFVRPTGGPQLIPEVLVRLGYGSGRGVSARARSTVPPPVRKLLRTVLPRRARQTVQARVGTLPNPLDSPLTRAVALDGDRCSWIRLNLAGREPHGTMQPGAEADELLAEIRASMLELEHPETGERIVTHVQSAEEAFGTGHHPDVPDLIVSFRDDLGVLGACRSDRVGLVRVPYEAAARRTGAHPPVPSYLWIGAPDLPKPAPPGAGKAVDLAPTVLSRLDVLPPGWLEGQALV
jgi:predicted AlkP superfamily phosphohydrolase/phosphomutase